MSSHPPRSGLNWTARIAWAVLLLLAGAALTVWGLSKWQAGARFLGVAAEPAPVATFQPVVNPAPSTPVQLLNDGDAAKIAVLETRIADLERATRRVENSAGRADALLVAFAARRAVDRGVALGYLEPLVIDRFGPTHEQAVATLITGARQPVRLDELVDQYARMEDDLRSGAPGEGWWAGVRREVGSLVSIRRADTPSPRPAARYDRAQAALDNGKVDIALAETMRMPGSARAAEWVGKARRYVTVHRALDEIESAALLGGSAPNP